MGFFKKLFGGGKPKTNRQASIPRATFKPIGDATFTLVSDDATFTVVTPSTPGVEEQESEAEAMLHQTASTQEEMDFLGGETLYVSSSNVQYFQYMFVYPDGRPQNELVVGFKDGSAYLYQDVSLDEASAFFHASSPGGEVWNRLRVRGTVFGYQKPYRLIEGRRLWHLAGADSIARHESIPASGEPVKGYHPATNYQGVKGPMGAEGGGVNLGKRGGSRKVAHFLSSRAKPKFGPRP